MNSITDPLSPSSFVKSTSLIALPFPLQSFQTCVGSVLPHVLHALSFLSVVEGCALVLLKPTGSLAISLSPDGSLLKFLVFSLLLFILFLFLLLLLFLHTSWNAAMNLSQVMSPCMRLLTEFLISPFILNSIFSTILLEELSGENALILFFCLMAQIRQSL